MGVYLHDDMVPGAAYPVACGRLPDPQRSLAAVAMAARDLLGAIGDEPDLRASPVRFSVSRLRAELARAGYPLETSAVSA